MCGLPNRSQKLWLLRQSGQSLTPLLSIHELTCIVCSAPPELALPESVPHPFPYLTQLVPVDQPVVRASCALVATYAIALQLLMEQTAASMSTTAPPRMSTSARLTLIVRRISIVLLTPVVGEISAMAMITALTLLQHAACSRGVRYRRGLLSILTVFKKSPRNELVLLPQVHKE